MILTIVPMSALLLWLHGQDTVTVATVDSVVQVTQHIGGFRDFLRLYVIPGLGTLFLGICATILWVFRQRAKIFFENMQQDAERQQKEADAKLLRDQALQATLDETNARTLVAKAASEAAALRAEWLGAKVDLEGQKQTQHYTDLKEIATKTEHSVNAAAEKAQRQIDQLTQQLMEKGIKPEKGNGP